MGEKKFMLKLDGKKLTYIILRLLFYTENLEYSLSVSQSIVFEVMYSISIFW